MTRARNRTPSTREGKRKDIQRISPRNSQITSRSGVSWPILLFAIHNFLPLRNLPPRFLAFCLYSPPFLSLSHTSPQIPPENCITRRSVGERDNISHARPRYTTKFLAEIYKGRRPGINLARSRNTGKETSLLNVRLPSRIMLTTDFTTLFLSFYFPFFFPLCIKLVNCEHLTMFFLRVFSFLSVYTFRMYIYIYIHFLVKIRLVPLFLPASRLESRLLDFSRYSQAWMGRRCNGVFYNRDALMTLSLRLIFR